MNITSQNLAKALIVSLQGKMEPDKLSVRFQKFIEKNHLIGIVPKVVEKLDQELRLIESAASAKIEISHDISAKTKDLIEQLIRKDSKDKSVIEVNPELVGGFRAIYRGNVYDASIKNYLNELRRELTK